MNGFFVRIILAVLVFGSAVAQAATYGVTSPNYTSTTDFTPPCSLGTCTNFTLAMKVSGTFDVPTLAANLTNSNIAAAVTAFSFSDGITTYASTDPAVRIYVFQVTTDASGKLTNVNILREKWLSGGSPHAVNDLFSYMSVTGSAVYANNNTWCGNVAMSLAGVADSCTSATLGPQVSRASAPGGTTFTAPGAAVAVPTLSEWAQIVLASLMTLIGLWQARRLSRR